MPQGEPSSTKATETTVDEWDHVEDQLERRKIQNRNAQRKFRECDHLAFTKKSSCTDDRTGSKTKQQKEESERVAQNQQQATGAYRRPEPEDITDTEEEGLPWGSVSLRHVFTTGRSKDESSQKTLQNFESSGTSGSSR